MRRRATRHRERLAGQGTFEWIEPSGGVVGLVRFPTYAVDTDRFYEVLLATTAPTWGRAIGSRSTTATSASASAGRPKPSCAPAWPRSRPRRASRERRHLDEPVHPEREMAGGKTGEQAPARLIEAVEGLAELAGCD